MPREVDDDAPDDDEDQAGSSEGDDALEDGAGAMPVTAASSAAPSEADLNLPLTCLDLSEVGSGLHACLPLGCLTTDSCPLQTALIRYQLNDIASLIGGA